MKTLKNIIPWLTAQGLLLEIFNSAPSVLKEGTQIIESEQFIKKRMDERQMR